MKITSPFGYLAALLLVLLGWVGATMVAAGAWDSVREGTLVPVTQERADAAGRSVAVFTDISQDERNVACRARDEAGKATAIKPARIDMTVESEGTEWQLINLLPKGRDGLKVRCAPSDKRVDNATYAFAVVDGYSSRRDGGGAIAVTGTLAGLALAGWVLSCRRSAKNSSHLSRKETTGSR